MAITPYPDIDALLTDLSTRIQTILGPQCIGVYLYGSLVWGDFDYAISDIDLLTATTDTLAEASLTALRQMHTDFAAAYPHWDNRIEVQYAPRVYLQTFKAQSSPIAVISPGEPFHVIIADSEWLLNWYFVQTYGVTLYGPTPAAVIAPISQAEFIQTVKTHALHWREYVTQTQGSRPYQGYAILTLCRALYTLTQGEQVSKQRAARWATTQLPGWADLIHRALEWRAMAQVEPADPSLTYPETLRFVEFMITHIETL